MALSCEEVRHSVSASLDGEPPELLSSEIALHLGGCHACRAWQEAAHVLTRKARLRSSEDAQPPAALLEALAAVKAPHRLESTKVARCTLFLVAVGQVLATGHLLIQGDSDGFHDLGALYMALVVGYLVVVIRPRRAAGMRSMAGAATILLFYSAVVDLVADRTTVWDEVPHLITLLGWLLIVFIARRTPVVGPVPESRLRRTLPSRVAWLRPSRPSADVGDRVDAANDELSEGALDAHRVTAVGPGIEKRAVNE
jgi:hypothetical protein